MAAGKMRREGYTWQGNVNLLWLRPLATNFAER